ncbi:MAG TPA: cupin domain-containing protein [Burkholderiales bacterium]|nr:cupin domain-containing protein [Burkholderiales bacterium]
MAATSKSMQTARDTELRRIVGELERLNVEARERNLWIRTKWNLPNEAPWHLGSRDPPRQGPHNLPVEHRPALPCLWKWPDIERYLSALIDLCPLELTERQSVLLTNPAFGMTGVKVTNTIRIAISIYKPGDVAHSHLHSPNASRTILSETGGYTIVEGERIEPRRGDLVFTPNGTWHEHGNDDDQPVIWADTLDWPLVDFLGCAWSRTDAEHAADHGSPMTGFSTRFYGRGGIRPAFTAHPRGEGRGLTPMFHYRGADIRAALGDLRDYAGDPYEGVPIELVNPQTGEAVFPTLSYRAQLLRTGEKTLPFRQTASQVYCALEGSGYTEVDGERLEWSRNDFFVVPGHRWRTHVNTGGTDAVLYSCTDAPLISKIGLYRAQGRLESGKLVELPGERN